MITQKLFKNGNSVVVTIPNEYLKALDLRDGSQVEVKTRGNELIVSRMQKKAETQGVDAKFMQMVDEFMTEHQDVLEELSKK